MSEVCIILQAPLANKPKYTRAMFKQVHIFDTETGNPQLQKAYLANTLINLCGLFYIFYEIDLLLKYQNGRFKRFPTDRRLSL